MIKLLENEQPKGIPVSKMKDGDVGIIVAWVVRNYIDRIVQRHGDNLITLGCNRGYSWPNLFNDTKIDERHRVRLLEKGEKLVVT